jgi:hypothetical protein
LQVRQRAYGIGENDPAVTEDLPELGGGFGALVFSQIGRPGHVDRIEGTNESNGVDRKAQLIGSCSLEQFDGL